MRILVIAAHADDEALGCGGTIARHAEAGDEVAVVFVADGVESRPAAGSGDLDRRQQAAMAATRCLGVRDTRFHLLPDNQLDSVPLLRIARIVEDEIARHCPEVIYTHSAFDLNVDHRLLAEAVVVATRPAAGAGVRAVYGFEVLSSTEWAFSSAGTFRPQRFVDISAQLDRKCEALACYADEMRDFPHPRSEKAVRALAAYRGATAGVEAAEAFVVYREIV